MLKYVSLSLLCPLLACLCLDQPLALWISVHIPSELGVFRVVSYLFLPPLHFLLWIVLALFWHFKKRESKFTALALSGIVGGGGVTVLKVLTGRIRPLSALNGGVSGCCGPTLLGDFHAFPSGHSLILFTLAYFIGKRYPNRRLWIYVAASVIALIRVLMLRHYLSDVMVGALIGMSVAPFMHQSIKKSSRPEPTR